MPYWCVRGARGRSGAGPAPLVFPSPPLSPYVPSGHRGVCGGLFRPGVPCPRPLVRHSMWSACSAVSSGNPFGSRPVSVVCPCALAPAPLAPPPPFPVTRAPCEVPSQGAGRAVPCGSCPSAFPARVPCSVLPVGGRGGVGGPAPVPPSLFLLSVHGSPSMGGDVHRGSGPVARAAGWPGWGAGWSP